MYTQWQPCGISVLPGRLLATLACTSSTYQQWLDLPMSQSKCCQNKLMQFCHTHCRPQNRCIRLHCIDMIACHCVTSRPSGPVAASFCRSPLPHTITQTTITMPHMHMAQGHGCPCKMSSSRNTAPYATYDLEQATPHALTPGYNVIAALPPAHCCRPHRHCWRPLRVPTRGSAAVHACAAAAAAACEP